MLAAYGRYALDGRYDAELLAMVAYGDIGFLPCDALLLAYAACYLEITEAHDLGLAQGIGRYAPDAVVGFELVLLVDDVFQSLQEPLVNLGKLFDTVDGITLLKGLGDGKDAQVCGVGKLVVEVVEVQTLVAHEAVHALPYHTQTFLNEFLETAADRHYLAY